MAGDLKGKKVAILVVKGFEQVELTEPRKALDTQAHKQSSSRPKKTRFADGILPNGVKKYVWMSLLTPPIRPITTHFLFRAE
jgi:hypothetical protein